MGTLNTSPSKLALVAITIALAACPAEKPAKPPAEAPPAVKPRPAGVQPARWRAFLETYGGPLPFGLEVKKDGDTWSAVVENGPERIELPATVEGESITISFPHYDSRIEAHQRSGKLAGTFHYRRASGPQQMRFWTRPEVTLPPKKARVDVSGRWDVRFTGDDDPAIGVFEQQPSGEVTGTILTPTGDLRFLVGAVTKRTLELSTFDGTHAYLVRAKPQADESVFEGQFWSGGKNPVDFIMKRAPDATLPDAAQLSAWTGKGVESLTFQDIDGEDVKLSELVGKPLVIEVFGSWCPNCHDAAPVIAELHRKYKDQGLVVVGLAFELSGNLERDREQVRRYRARHGIEHPLLLAGTSKKDAAAKRLPFLDQLVAYPTTIFVKPSGESTLVHTGFSGPATGKDHEALKKRFDDAARALVGG